MFPQSTRVPRVYIDTSVANVYLFGQAIEVERYLSTEHLFRFLDSRVVDGVISLYTIQEIYSYCQDNFPVDVQRDVIRLSIIKSLQVDVEIAPMLTRLERLVHQRKYPITDSSDVPHAIIAGLRNCDAIITYDSHFDAINSVIMVMTPEEFLRHLA
jgi:predicted nucleic acid-binding protein